MVSPLQIGKCTMISEKRIFRSAEILAAGALCATLLFIITTIEYYRIRAVDGFQKQIAQWRLITTTFLMSMPL